MLRDLTEVSTQLREIVLSHVTDKKWFSKKVKEAAEKYCIPLGMAADIMNGNKRVTDYGDAFLCFLCTEVIAPEIIDECFTGSEIAMWKGACYNVETLTEIRIPMLQVASDQWIGATTFHYLLKIENAHMMRYNEATQRVLRKKMNATGEVRFEPYINQRAISEIKKLLENGTYISNTITLNLIQDYDLDYINGEIVIQNLKKDTPVFDILDGYHRYRAMKKISMGNPDFDYPMELRIVTFSEEKAKQFIFQEDQKTKMRRVDSKTYDQDDPANKVVAELNDGGIFRGLLTKNGLRIDTAVFTEAVRCVYFKRTDPKTRKYQREVVEDINTKAKWMERVSPEIFDEYWDKNDVVRFLTAARVADSESSFRTIYRLLTYHDFMTDNTINKSINKATRIIEKEGGSNV